jgi:hypothetical protein
MSVITTEQEIARLTALTAELVIKLKAEKAAEEKRVVSFMSKQKLAKALSNGRTFMTAGGRHLWYDKTCAGSPFRSWDGPGSATFNGTTMDYSWDSFNELIETTPKPVPWYLVKDLPWTECFVSDSNKNPGPGSSVVMITNYNADARLKFQGASDWKYATPTGN